MRIHNSSLIGLLLLFGCQSAGEEAQDLAAHGSSGSTAVLDVVANFEIDSLFCSSPNLQARRPQFDCQGHQQNNNDEDHDTDSDSDSDQNHRRSRPNVSIDASVDEINFIAIELKTKARKRNSGWVTVGSETLVVDPILAMNGLSLESIPLGSGNVRQARYDRIKIEVDGIGVHFHGTRASETYRPSVRSTTRTSFEVGSGGASVGVDLHLTVRFADDSDSDQIAFWFDH